MTDQIETLFYEVTPEALPLLAELQRPLLRHVFVLDKVEVALILTDNYVFLGQQAAQDVPTHFLPLTFEVKFETIYQSIPVPPYLGRTKAALESRWQSDSKDSTAASSSLSMPNTPPLPNAGAWNWKRKSTKETFTVCSRPRRKSGRVPLLPSTWLSDCGTTKWWPSRPSPRKNSTQGTKANSPFRIKSG